MNATLSVYLIIMLGWLLPGTISGQAIQVNIGVRDSLKSEILQENRNVLIHLPRDYDSSTKSYPILYQLDGDEVLLFETVAVVNRLVQWEERIPEVIVVAIENTNRSRDMWPTNTKYNPKPNIAGSEAFLAFIEKELMPYIENKYRINDERILCGQSLSALFTIYAFLAKPQLFDSYIASSGAFPDCEEYIKEFSHKSFQKMDLFNGQSLFITNGLKDELDPDGRMNRGVINFSNTLKEQLGNSVKYQYQTYENLGHVPFYSLYDGLKFVFESNPVNK